MKNSNSETGGIGILVVLVVLFLIARGCFTSSPGNGIPPKAVPVAALGAGAQAGSGDRTETSEGPAMPDDQQPGDGRSEDTTPPAPVKPTDEAASEAKTEEARDEVSQTHVAIPSGYREPTAFNSPGEFRPMPMPTPMPMPVPFHMPEVPSGIGEGFHFVP